MTRPTISVFRPAKDKDTGAAVLIAPGGGYNILAWDLEGEEVAGSTEIGLHLVEDEDKVVFAAELL